MVSTAVPSNLLPASKGEVGDYRSYSCPFKPLASPSGGGVTAKP